MEDAVRGRVPLIGAKSTSDEKADCYNFFVLSLSRSLSSSSFLFPETGLGGCFWLPALCVTATLRRHKPMTQCGAFRFFSFFFLPSSPYRAQSRHGTVPTAPK